jgi:hypothetical protein
VLEYIQRFTEVKNRCYSTRISEKEAVELASLGHLGDVRQVLERTRRFGLKMNPKKCAFSISAGQFLGFLVHARGIEIGLKS